MGYTLNGVSLGKTTTINDASYDISWFSKATPEQLAQLNVIYVEDPVIPVVPTSDAELARIKDISKNNNIKRLWQAAHDYEYASINGMAIGMLVLGVLQNKPKAIDVKNWSQSIWDLYYSRKATVTAIFVPALLDFSSIGPMPHSIPELMIELGIT